METRLRAALLDWLSGDPVIAEAVNIIDEAETSRAALPWLALVCQRLCRLEQQDP